MNEKEKAAGAIKLQRKLEQQARKNILSGKGESSANIGLVTVYQGSGGLSNPEEEKKDGKG
jgi:hypothetical protein